MSTSKFIRFIPVLFVFGCSNSYMAVRQVIFCEPLSADPADETELGFSANAVRELMTSSLPTEVGWSRKNISIEDSASVELGLGNVDTEQISICEQDGSYGWQTDIEEPALGLQIPYEVTLADGQLVSSGTFQVYAVNVAEDAIYVYGEGSAAVMGDYAVALIENMESEDYWTSDLEWTASTLSFGGAWPAVEVALSASYDSPDLGVGSKILEGNWE